MQPVAVNSGTKYEAFNSKNILSPVNAGILQPIVLDTSVVRIESVSSGEGFVGAFASNDTVMITIPNSTATILQCNFSGDAHATWMFNPFAEPTPEQEILDQSFARLSAFTLEPDQPTENDVIRKDAYRFPNR